MIDQMDTPFACYLQTGTSMVAGLPGAGNCLMKAGITSSSGKFCEVSLGERKLTGLYFKAAGRSETEGEGFCLLHQDVLEEGKTGFAGIARKRLYIYEKN